MNMNSQATAPDQVIPPAIAPTCRELFEEDGVESVHRISDDSWRHGAYVTEVFHRGSDKTYWSASYRRSTGGETNELMEGTAHIAQVYPVETKIIRYVAGITPKPKSNPSALNAEIPKHNSMWEHTNGCYYTVLFITNLDFVSEDHPSQVVYQGANGKYWSRALSDWHRSMRKVLSSARV